MRVATRASSNESGRGNSWNRSETAWQSLKGRIFGMRIPGFGELTMSKKDMEGPSKPERGSVSSNFEHGVCVWALAGDPVLINLWVARVV